MILELNLASEPFRNRVLPWTLIGVVAGISLVLLGYNVMVARTVQQQARAAENQMRELRVRAAQVEAERERLTAELSPVDLQSLQAAHRLVDRKGFSWTQLFNDLEAALPPSIRVARISVRDVVKTPNVTVADIAMTVTGRTSQDVTDTIATMNASGVFVVTPLSQAADSRGRGIEATLQVNYLPPAFVPGNANEPEATSNAVARTTGF